ncbi:PDZ domain-containing protein [Aeromicrobium sp. UC242_57]
MSEGGPAALAGLQAGDVLTSIDGRRATTAAASAGDLVDPVCR